MIEVKHLRSVLIEYTLKLKEDMIENQKSSTDIDASDSVDGFLKEWKEKQEERIKKEFEKEEKIKNQLKPKRKWRQ